MSRHASCGRRTSTWTRGELVRRSTARCLLCGRLVRVPLCDANWASVTRPPLRRDGVYSSRQANQPRHHACDSYSEYARMSPAAVFSPSRASRHVEALPLQYTMSPEKWRQVSSKMDGQNERTAGQESSAETDPDHSEPSRHPQFTGSTSLARSILCTASSIGIQTPLLQDINEDTCIYPRLSRPS